MDELWNTIAALAVALHRDRIEVVASTLEAVRSPSSVERCRLVLGPGADQRLFETLKLAWSANPEVSGSIIAAGLRAASHTAYIIRSEASVDVVWTGPRTGLIPTRKTEQVICEVIEESTRDLFVVSYVFHNAQSIIAALNNAVRRGVAVQILLESSHGQGGAVSLDGLTAMRNLVPNAEFYIWNPVDKAKSAGSFTASVHAKCVAADHRIAFVTSANLTSAAMERNMELGVLLKGGTAPHRLHSHLQNLISTAIAIKWP